MAEPGEGTPNDEQLQVPPPQEAGATSGGDESPPPPETGRVEGEGEKRKVSEERLTEEERAFLQRLRAQRISQLELQVSDQDKEWFKRETNKIRDVINDPQRGLTADERILIDKYLQGEATKEEAQNAIQKLGLDATEIDRYRSLYKRIFRDISPVEVAIRLRAEDPDLARKLEEAQKALSIENLIAKNFFEYDDEGRLRFTKDPNKRREYKKIIEESFYGYFERIDSNPSQYYKDIYNLFIDVSFINGLRSLLYETLYSEELMNKFSRSDPKAYGEFTSFMRHMISYSYSIVYYGELFHDLPIYAMDPNTFENWSGFLGRLFPSETAAFLDDKIVELGMEEVERYFRKSIAMNSNKIPNDILGGQYEKGDVIWHLKDQEKIVETIRKRARDVGVGEIKDWEVLRAITYAKGISLVNLRLIEIFGTANPTETFKGIPEVTAKLVQWHKWRQGRGSREIFHVPELFEMEIVHNPERRGFLKRLFRKRRWVPERLHKKLESLRSIWGESLDRALLDREGTYQELMNILNIGSLPTRASWRIDYLINMPEIKRKLEPAGLDYNEVNTTWGRASWNKLFDIIVEELGVGALPFYIDARVQAEMKSALQKHLERDVTDEEVREYSMGRRGLIRGNKAFDKVFEIKNEKGEKKKVSFSEFQQAKEWQIRGEVFRYLLERSPGDFILNLTQLVPELVNFDPNEPESNIFLTESQIDADPLKKIKKKEILKLRNLYLDRWGYNNFQHLQWIRNWISDLVTNNTIREKLDTVRILEEEKIERLRGTTDKRLKEKIEGEIENKISKAVLDYFFEEMGTALTKTRDAGQVKMSPDQISDEILREYIFGGAIDTNERGIVNYLTRTGEDFGDYDRIGNYGFFYETGKLWSIKEGNINPNTTDLNWFLVYKYIAQAGESVIRRLLSDPVAWDKVVSGVAELDHLLWRAGSREHHEEAWKEIYELHKNIHSLEGIIGTEAANRANYLIASLVSSYFWEHNLSRLPGGILLNWPARLIFGRKLSLSKIYGGLFAHSMGEDDLIKYYRRLALDDHVIAEKGRWSYEQLQLAFDSKTDTWIAGNVLPTVLSIAMAYMLYSYIRRTLEEEVEGKKR